MMVGEDVPLLLPESQAQIYISDVCNNAVDLYQQCMQKQDTYQLYKLIKTEYDRLKIWASSIGVYSRPPASADDRLRENDDLRVLVIELFTALGDHLRHYVSTEDESGNNEEPTSSDETCSSSEDGQATPKVQNAHSRLLRNIRHINSRLFSVLILVRQPTHLTSNEKVFLFDFENQLGADTYRELIKDFEEYIEFYLNHTFRSNITPSTTTLSRPIFSKLKNGAIIRRKALILKERHKRKLRANVGTKFKTQPFRFQEAAVQEQVGESHQARPQIVSIVPSKSGSIELSETVPSVIVKPVQDRSELPKAQPAPKSSKSRIMLRGKLDIPRPPRIEGNEQETSCYVCGLMLESPLLLNDRWSKHVLEDIDAFICLFECDKPDVLYKTPEDWYEHMQTHRMQWRCMTPAHAHLEFDTRADLETHLKDDHPTTLTNSQIKLLSNRGRRPLPTIFEECPLCGQTASDIEANTTLSDQSLLSLNERNQMEIRSLHRHIESHMYELALLSILPSSGDVAMSESIAVNKDFQAAMNDPGELRLKEEGLFSLPQDFESPQKLKPFDLDVSTAVLQGQVSPGVFDVALTDVHEQWLAFIENQQPPPECQNLELDEWEQLCREIRTSRDRWNTFDNRWHDADKALLAGFRTSIDKKSKCAKNAWLFLFIAEGLCTNIEIIRAICEFTNPVDIVILPPTAEGEREVIIVFRSRKDAETSLAEMDGFQICNVPMSVQLAYDANKPAQLIQSQQAAGFSQQESQAHKQVQNDVLDIDYSKNEVEAYIDHMLRNNEKLQTFSKYHSMIRDELSSRAYGSLQWTKLQLMLLQKPRDEREFLLTLKALPSSLEDTYDVILSNIDEHLKFLVRRILLVLCFARVHLTLGEVNDSLAIDVQLQRYEPDRKLSTPGSIMEICRGLVEEDTIENGIPTAAFTIGGPIPTDESTTHLFTDPCITDYLMSDRIQSSPARTFALSESESHATMCMLCLICLNQEDLYKVNQDDSDEVGFSGRFMVGVSFIRYAATFWVTHFKMVGDKKPEELEELAYKLFTTKSLFKRWKMIDGASDDGSSETVRKSVSNIYFLALYGLHQILGRVLHGSTNGIDEEGGNYGNALQAAAFQGDIDIVQLLVNQGANVRANCGKYGNALTAASWAGHQEIVEMLLEYGADVNAQGGMPGNALQAAFRNGHDDIVEILLHHGAEIQNGDKSLLWASKRGRMAMARSLIENGTLVDVVDHNLRTPLSWASNKGHAPTVRLLLEQGAHVDSADTKGHTSLCWASRAGYAAIVQLLLDYEAQIDPLESDYGCTPLSWAAWEGHEAVVRLLLERGAQVDSRDKYGRTPLSYAVCVGNETVVQLLLEHGALVDSLDTVWRCAPLSWAVYCKEEATVRLLLAHGAQVNLADKDGRTALFYATEGGDETLVRLLLEQNADTESVELLYGQTPLLFATQMGKANLVNLLLKAGANPNISDGVPRSALEIAALAGYVEIVRILLDSGADVNLQLPGSDSALLAASRSGALPVVEILLEAGADLQAKDSSGCDAFQVASQREHQKIVRLLLDASASAATALTVDPVIAS